jgi:hypothetical protein
MAKDKEDKGVSANAFDKSSDSSGSDNSWVLSSLEHDQLVRAKKHPIPRRHLKGAELAVLWGLRIYLLFMMVVVFYQIWTAR